MVGRPLVEIKLPAGIIVGAILRGDAVIIQRPQTVILEHDRVVILATARAVKKIEQMFRREAWSSSDRRPACPASPM